MESPSDWNPDRAAETLSENGLGATVCAVMPPGRELTGADRATIRAARDYLRRCIDAALDELVESLRTLADCAGGREVRLAVEPLNRFETSVINTAEQALEVIERVESSACGLLLDTFRMNIEERDPAAAILGAGSRLAHFHACANDRGAPGRDHIDWAGISTALAKVRYTGLVCIESFTSENEAIATAAAIWRPLALSQDEIATNGLAFLRGALQELDGQ